MRRTPRGSTRPFALVWEIDMHQLIYLVGLIVILAILSFFGLR
jgi:hypothetical protein